MQYKILRKDLIINQYQLEEILKSEEKTKLALELGYIEIIKERKTSKKD